MLLTFNHTQGKKTRLNTILYTCTRARTRTTAHAHARSLIIVKIIRHFIRNPRPRRNHSPGREKSLPRQK